MQGRASRQQYTTCTKVVPPWYGMTHTGDHWSPVHGMEGSLIHLYVYINAAVTVRDTVLVRTCKPAAA